MRKIVVAGAIHPAGIEVLERIEGATIVYERAVDLSYENHMAGADALLIRTQKLSADTIKAASRLGFVSRHGVGYDSIDLEALNARRIPLAIVGDVNSRTVAEHAFALLLASSKRLLGYDDAVRRGNWRYRDSLRAAELTGKTLLVIGFGRIGRHLARMASGFDVRLEVFDPFVDDEAIAAADAIRATDLDAALANADLVSIHVPKVSEKATIGREELQRMRPGVIIVNTARGGLVDEGAISELLTAGTVGGYATDVFAIEPPIDGSPLTLAPNTLLTPHSASLTAECAMRMSVAAASNIADYFAGRTNRSLIVNADVAQPNS